MSYPTIIKGLIAFSLVQCAIVGALVLSHPARRQLEANGGQTTSPSGQVLSSPPHLYSLGQDQTSVAEAAGTLQSPGDRHAATASEAGPFLAPSPFRSRTLSFTNQNPAVPGATHGKKPPTSGLQSAEALSPIPLEPTLEQAQQTLDVPLAFFHSSLAPLTAQQTSDVAAIANQFSQAVADLNQNPAAPSEIASYFTVRDFANEQVRAVSGDSAYESLINARAQAAGNYPISNGP